MTRRTTQPERTTTPVADPLPGRDGLHESRAAETWFLDHFDQAADEVLSFLDGDRISLEGKDVADLGCGDGIVDLGVAIRGRPRRLVGYDLNPTDTDALLRRARAHGVAERIPECLEFQRCEPVRIPAPDDAFDVVITWSAFEHVTAPVPVLQEIRRILRPGGVLFLQLWPFFFSEHGSHLWHWFDRGFVTLEQSADDVEHKLRSDTETDPRWIDQRLVDYQTLNRITLDELQRSLLTAGLWIAKLELLTHPVHLTPALNRYPLTDLGISGVKLLACPASA